MAAVILPMVNVTPVEAKLVIPPAAFDAAAKWAAATITRIFTSGPNVTYVASTRTNNVTQFVNHGLNAGFTVYLSNAVLSRTDQEIRNEIQRLGNAAINAHIVSQLPVQDLRNANNGRGAAMHFYRNMWGTVVYSTTWPQCGGLRRFVNHGTNNGQSIYLKHSDLQMTDGAIRNMMRDVGGTFVNDAIANQLQSSIREMRNANRGNGVSIRFNRNIWGNVSNVRVVAQ